MRTTITIDDDLLEDLKRREAESGTTVSRLIEDSVRLAAARPRGKMREFGSSAKSVGENRGKRPQRREQCPLLVRSSSIDGLCSRWPGSQAQAAALAMGGNALDLRRLG